MLATVVVDCALRLRLHISPDHDTHQSSLLGGGQEVLQTGRFEAWKTCEVHASTVEDCRHVVALFATTEDGNVKTIWSS